MALIRVISLERVYIMNHQSMSIRIFVHTLSKRAETSALLDMGATENFINEAYTRKACIPFKQLVKPRKIINVDGTENVASTIKFYTDLKVQTGSTKQKMHFFLTRKLKRPPIHIAFITFPGRQKQTLSSQLAEREMLQSSPELPEHYK